MDLFNLSYSPISNVRKPPSLVNKKDMYMTTEYWWGWVVVYLKSLPGCRILVRLGGCLPEEFAWIQNTGGVEWLFT